MSLALLWLWQYYNCIFWDWIQLLISGSDIIYQTVWLVLSMFDSGGSISLIFVRTGIINYYLACAPVHIVVYCIFSYYLQFAVIFCNCYSLLLKPKYINNAIPTKICKDTSDLHLGLTIDSKLIENACNVF